MEAVGIAASILSIAEVAGRAIAAASRIKQLLLATEEINALESDLARLSIVVECVNDISFGKSTMDEDKRGILITLLQDYESIATELATLVTACKNRENRLLGKRLVPMLWAKNRARIEILRRQLKDVMRVLTLFLATLNTASSRPQPNKQWTNTKTEEGMVSPENQLTRALPCQCSCHELLTWGFHTFNGWLGSFSFSWLGSRSFLCCACQNERRMVFTYYSPRWFCRQGLVFSMPLEGRLHMALSFPRVIPPDSEIFLCAHTGDTTRLKHLLASGQASLADIAAPYNLTPLALAIMSNQIETSSFLLGQGATELFPVHTGANSDIFDYFLSCSRIDYDLSASGAVSSLVAISQTDWHFNLLDRYRELNSLSCLRFSRLHNSVLRISCEDIRAAARASVDSIDKPDTFGRTALHWAVLLEQELDILVILRYGANISAKDLNGASALHLAASSDWAIGVNILLDHGADVEESDRFGNQPLHYAATTGALSAIKVLIQRGADVNSPGLMREPPLFCANRGWQPDASKLLIALGASMTQVDLWGYDIFLDAIFTDSHDVLRDLLAPGVEVRNRLVDGRTALHVAALNSDQRTIEIMAQGNIEGIDPSTRDHSGYTAVEYAQLRRDSEQIQESFHSLIQNLGEYNQSSIPVVGELELDDSADDIFFDAVQDVREYVD